MKRHRSSLVRWIAGPLVVLLTAVPGLLMQAGTAGASAPSPTVTGPIAGTPSLLGTNFDLAQVGYEQSEFFLSGTARSYTSATPLTTDGKWTVTQSDTAPYTTRALVRRPIDPAAFNGTVIVEWLNVSGGLDYPPDWVQFQTELVRAGYAWVGVSAQWVGVNTLKNGAPPVGDPARYASLSHPGDSYSYDIFSQAGQALRDDASRATPKLLDGLTPSTYIADGHSQSAARLVTYIDAVAMQDDVYDGYLVHGRGARGSALSQVPPIGAPIVPAPSPNTLIRDDIDVPVFVVQAETDINNNTLYSRQPDATNFRLWEIAGGAHFDNYALFLGPNDTGGVQSAAANLAAMQNPPTETQGAGTCNLGVNAGGTHWVMNAALDAINQWVVNGTPPTSTLIQVTTAPGVSPVGFVRDADTGIVLGGVRSPHVDAPIATLSGLGNTPVPNCTLFGTTTPFTPEHLAALYKNHGQFVSKWGQAAQSSVNAGWLLPVDAEELTAAAAQSQIGK